MANDVKCLFNIELMKDELLSSFSSWGWGSWWQWAVLGYILGIKWRAGTSLECWGETQTVEVIVTVVIVTLPYSWCTTLQFTKCLCIRLYIHMCNLDMTLESKETISHDVLLRPWPCLPWGVQDRRRRWELPSDLWEEEGHLGGQTKNQSLGTCL